MATPWRVPPLFRGKTVAILASGPSMSLAVAEAVRAARVPSLVTNETFLLAPWADILVANDAAWWTVRAQDALKFRGLKVCVQTGICPFPAVMELRNTGLDLHDQAGFDPDPECIRTGGNSGYSAVHIAMQAGASRILLCGLDLGGANWHPAHSEHLRITQPHTYTVWARRFRSLVKPAAERGIEILNVTPNSALDCFPKMALDEALAMCPEMG